MDGLLIVDFNELGLRVWILRRGAMCGCESEMGGRWVWIVSMAVATGLMRMWLDEARRSGERTNLFLSHSVWMWPWPSQVSHFSWPDLQSLQPVPLHVLHFVVPLPWQVGHCILVKFGV